MKISILAARRQRAIESIAESSGLDLTNAAFPKTPDVAHRELLILERIAKYMKEQGAQSASTSTSSMTVKETVAAVEAGKVSAQDALVMEEARGSGARKTLVSELEDLIEAEEAAQTAR